MQLYRLTTFKPFQLHSIHYSISDSGSSFNDSVYISLVSKRLTNNNNNIPSTPIMRK